MNNDKYQRMPGEGFNSRSIPTPAPSVKAAAADAKANETIQESVLARPPLKSYPMSTGRQPLAPSFETFSATLAAEEAADRMIRESAVAGILNLNDKTEPRETLARLAAGVKAGELDEAGAHKLFATLHPGVAPESIK